MSRVPRWSWPRPALAWVVVLVWVVGLAAFRPLAVPDEGRYVGVAWEMLQRGDFLVPTLDGLPFFHKPPLFYWVTAAALAVFGPHEWAGRAAPLLGGLLCLFSVWALAWRWLSQDVAARILPVLATTPLLLLGAQYANLDMLVAGLICLTIALLADACLRLDAGLPARRSIYAAYVCAGLGVLAKGLIGVVLPGLVMVLTLVWARRWRHLLRLMSPVGLLLLLIVTGPWFWLMGQTFPNFLHYFFVEQHFQRYTQTGFNNMHPAWFYPAVIGLATLWWWPLLLTRLPRLWRSAWQAPVGAPAFLQGLALLWFAGILGFFTLPASKLVGYILPTIPPLALLVALAWQEAPRAWPRRLLAGGIVAGALLCLGGVAWVSWTAPKSSKPLAQTLRAERQNDEPVVMLERYVYDVMLYARLKTPAIVLDDWRDPGIHQRDNWQRELLDASDFWPEVGRQVLQQPEALPKLACEHPVLWLLGDASLSQEPVYAPWLAQAQERARHGSRVLWKLSRPASCIERPSQPSK